MDEITITLTREEAVALVMLREAAVVGGEEDYIFRNVKAVAEQLTDVDHSLAEEQFEKWRDIGEPDFDLSNTASVGFEA